MEEKTEAMRGFAQSDRMGAMPEGRLLFRTAVPLCLSMLIQALYNVVDSIFVSRLGENALTAVSLAYPMCMLMIAVSVGTGVGINSLISRKLGAKRPEDAARAADNGLLLMLLSSLIFLFFGVFGAGPFVASYTGVPEIYEMGTTYLSICCTYCIGVFMQVYAERVMQSQGKAFWSMMIQLAGAVFNIVFDPILIFGLLGFPKLGIAGAAIATVGGQIFGMLLSFFILFGKQNEVRITIAGFVPDAATIREIYAVGIPAIVLQAIGTVMNLVMNVVLIGFTATAVAVLGVYFKVQSFAFMPLIGINNAAMSIEAYNYGAGNKKRILRTLKLAVVSGFVLMVTFTVLFISFPDEILMLFNASPEMLRIGRAALTIMPLGLPVAAGCVCTSGLFQAVGNGVYSMILSIVRQLAVLVPSAWLLAKLTNDVTAVWWSFPIAEVAGLLLCAFFFVRIYREKIKPLPELPQ